RGFTEAFRTIEFGKQFHYQPQTILQFDMQPQPSFNKDFELLRHTLVKNEAAGLRNLIFTDSPRQSERLYSIFSDLPGADKDTPAPFSTVQLSMREGFTDMDLGIACYTDH